MASLIAATSILHHCYGSEYARGDRGVGTANRLDQDVRRNMPVHASVVLATPAGASNAAIAADRIPVTVGLRLIVGIDEERHGLSLQDVRAAVETEERHAAHRDLDS